MIGSIVKYKGDKCKIIGYHSANHDIIRIKTPNGTLIINKLWLDE